MFGAILAKAIRAPLQDVNWRQKILLGGMMVLLPSLALALAISGQLPVVLVPVLMALSVAPALVAWGYVYRVFVDALNGQEFQVMPEWGPWKQYARVGFWLFVIFWGYVFLMAVGITALMAVLGLIPPGEDQGRLGLMLILIMAASMVLYGFLPIAFARFAAERRVWAAFDPGAVWTDVRRVVRGSYPQACFAFYGLMLFVNLVLGALPLVGLFVGSLVLFYLMVVFAWIFGHLIGVKGGAFSGGQKI